MGDEPRMTDIVRKEQIISALVDVRRSLLDCARGFSEEEARRTFRGEWSVLDLLAHLTGWDHANEEAIGAVVTGRMPRFYKFKDPDWKGYNAVLVRKYRLETLPAQIGQAAFSHALLIEELGSVAPEDIDRDSGLRYKGWKITVRRLMEAEGKDEAVHLEQLREYARAVGAK